ncbi:hypothetical protein RZS08_44665, partial [Arthrospira platensis SPKY1]|nr:hypothetical protein [Arthrospira platensis SPKY1]
MDGHTHGNPFGNAPGFGPSPLDGVRIDLNQEQWLASALWQPTRNPQREPDHFLPSINVQVSQSDFTQNEIEGAFLINAFTQKQSQITAKASVPGTLIAEIGRA